MRGNSEVVGIAGSSAGRDGSGSTRGHPINGSPLRAYRGGATSGLPSGLQRLHGDLRRLLHNDGTQVILFVAAPILLEDGSQLYDRANTNEVGGFQRFHFRLRELPPKYPIPEDGAAVLRHFRVVSLGHEVPI